MENDKFPTRGQGDKKCVNLSARLPGSLIYLPGTNMRDPKDPKLDKINHKGRKYSPMSLKASYTVTQ